MTLRPGGDNILLKREGRVRGQASLLLIGDKGGCTHL